MTEGVDRRTFIERATVAAGALALPGLVEIPRADASTAARPVIDLPSPAQVRADMTHMVNFGSRYTGTTGHANYIDWLEEELVAAGVTMLPRDDFPLTIWEAQRFGLELLEGPRAGAVPVSAYYPRTRETPDAGVTGKLVYAGVAPLPALDLTGAGLQSALAKYPSQLGSWAQSLTGSLGVLEPGSILLVDVPMPLPLLFGAFLGLVTHLTWSGHTLADWAAGDLKRTALAPGIVAMPLGPFKALGAAGVVFILDASAEAVKGGYMPFENGFEEIPALFVDRDTGTMLRGQAASNPKARLTLTARRRNGTAPALLGYLPGTSDESLILATHTDGEGFVEENGGTALVQLARHFGSLPTEKRLRRTLVFSLWPGHMASGMPQLGGVLEKHPDVVRTAAAAITVEHLGCSEWVDDAEKGYHATGEAESLLVWTTQGRMQQLAAEVTDKHELPRTTLMRPPVQFGVGGAFQTTGVPQIGFLTAPCYLLTDSPGGDLDKLDEKLASRQIAWVAELLMRLDAEPAAGLLSGDPTLGRRADGPHAKFPVLPAPRFAARLSATTPAKLLKGSPVRGSLSLNRIGMVRLHIAFEHRHGHKSVTTTLADGLVHVARAGSQSFELQPTAKGLAALRHAGSGRLALTARFRERGATHVRRARRPLNRSA